MVYQRAFIAKPHNTQKLSSLSIFGTKHELNQRSPTFLARQTQSHVLVPAVILQPCVTETNKQWGLLCLRTQPIDHNTAPHISWKRETDKLMRRERTVEPIYFLVCVCVWRLHGDCDVLRDLHWDICHLPTQSPDASLGLWSDLLSHLPHPGEDVQHWWRTNITQKVQNEINEKLRR